MARFIAQRLLGVIGTLFAMSILVFCIVHILPGNVAYAMLGEYATPDAVATLEAKLGLNDPLVVQYWHWLSGMLRGDLGQSVVMERPAADVIVDALGRSAILAAFSFAVVALGGIVLGTYAATHDGRLSDRLLTLIQFLFIAVPDFFWSILVIIVFASWLHWLPATGYVPLAQAGLLVWLSHLVLPVLVLATGLIAHVSRMTRSSMLEVLESRYVLAARAKGLPERLVLRRHALPNALLPTITILAIDVGILIGGVVVVETVFVYPGLGQLMVDEVSKHDVPVVQACGLIFAATFILLNMTADILAIVSNPRLSHPRW